jgi:hypothetical protein
MRLISETNLDGTKIQYFEGCDINKMLNHPSDGSDGIMVVFIKSYKDETIVFNRNSMINSILEGGDRPKRLSEIFDQLNNNYLMVYQTSGFTEVVYQGVKNKIENYRSFPWAAVSGEVGKIS